MTATPFEIMMWYMRRAYKGEDMVIKAACRAAQCPRSAIWDSEEAVALLIEHDWTWDDVLTVNS